MQQADEYLIHASNGDRAGRDHLENRSRLQLRISKLTPVKSILIVDDTVFDANVLASSLRLVLGHDVDICHVQQLRAASKAIADKLPDLVFLDDRLGHAASAEISLNLVRGCGFTRPVIVMSGLLTRVRRHELLKLGVADVVHKDDINAARISEAVLKVFDALRPDDSGTPCAN